MGDGVSLKGTLSPVSDQGSVFSLHCLILMCPGEAEKKM